MLGWELITAELCGTLIILCVFFGLLSYGEDSAWRKR